METEKRARVLLFCWFIVGVGSLLIHFLWLAGIQWRVANELQGIEDWLARDPRYAESLDSLYVGFANIRGDLLAWYDMIPFMLFSVVTFLSGFFLLPANIRHSLAKHASSWVSKVADTQSSDTTRKSL